MSNYVVYMHTVPNGKVYIGITKHNPPERRWGKGGRRYKNNAKYADLVGAIVREHL